MPRPRRGWLFLAVVLLVVPLAGLSPLQDNEVAANRRTLAALRRDQPDEYNRLVVAARAFLALPEEQRAQLVKLDQQFQQLSPPVRERRLAALRHYARWLQSLPKVQREELQKLKGKARLAEVARLRREESQRRRDWQVAFRNWEPLTRQGRLPVGRPAPTRLGELDTADHLFVYDYLRPLLSAAEWQELEKAAGSWPRFPRTLVEVADRHPVALQGQRGITHLKELPREVRTRLEKPLAHKLGKGKEAPKARIALKQLLARSEGKWPDFAARVAEVAQSLDVSLPHELWPSRRKDLSVDVQEFLKNKLEPVLNGTEKGLLRQAEGNWPRYPQTIQNLAARHALTVPWQTLPGPRARWDGYRLAARLDDNR
jgi:hypothetical protein